MHIQDTLQHYTQVIRSRFRFILLGVIFGGTVTLVISVFLPPVYQASALVKVNSASTMATTASGNDVFSAQAQAVSYAILVTSPEVLQEATDKLPGMTVDELKNVVSDSPVDNTQLIEIGAYANRPQRAADIVNVMAATFVQFQETQERTRLQNAADQLTQNLTQAKIDINAAQQQLTTLQNTHATQDDIAQQQSLFATDQSTYNALLSNNEQLQDQEQQTATILSIAQKALPPAAPTSPQLALNTILAASMSLLLTIALALLQDWLDVTIKTVDDVVQLAGLEPLGSIPLGASTTQLFDLRSEHTNEVKEAYSMLGASFRTLCEGERTILVTSPSLASGTTASATYLALSLAKSGMRVLLVDANVRHPSLHNIFLRPDTHGLVESLQNIHTFQEPSAPLPHLWLKQWKTHIPNLWLLPAGPLGPYPTSLLHEPALGMLLDRLLGRIPNAPERLEPRLIDIIIFDTAALEQGTDAYLLAAIADATVLVVEAGKESKNTLHRLSSTFKQFGAPVLGVIINRQQKQHRSYFYAPRRLFTKRKAVASPSFDRTSSLPLPQESNSRVPEQVISEEIQQPFTQEQLQSASKRIQPRLNLKIKQPQQKHPLPQLPTVDEYMHAQQLLAFDLPETPAPLPFIYPNTGISMLTNHQTDEASDDSPGKLQFAPLLRLSQDRASGKNSEA